jgi:hypothetical protein
MFHLFDVNFITAPTYSIQHGNVFLLIDVGGAVIKLTSIKRNAFPH